MLAALLLLALPATAPLQGRPPLERYQFGSFQMGTLFRIVLYAENETQALEGREAAFRRVRELDALLSDYRPDSELNRLCRAPAGTVVPVSQELFHVLRRAREISERTRGAFDVTVGPLVDLWRAARRSGRLPSDREVADARQRVGYEFVVLDEASRSVHLARDGMRLDLGGIAKGYAADEALEVLRRLGLGRALVDAGGDIRVGEPPPGEEGWRVGRSSGRSKPLLLSDRAVATSGDDYRFVVIEGRRYSHVLDPATGLGLTESRPVTVIARDALTADALATAGSVMSPETALRLLHGVNAIEFSFSGLFDIR